MPQRKSAKKELRKSIKRKKQNLIAKNKIKKAIKQFKQATKKGDLETAKKTLSLVYQALDKAAKRNVIHPNKSARKKSRISKLLKPLKQESTS